MGIPNPPQDAITQAGRMRAGLAAAFLAVVAICLSLAVHLAVFDRLDSAVRAGIASVRTAGGTTIMLLVSYLGSEYAMPFVVLSLGWWLARRSKPWAAYLVVTVATSSLWQLLLKPLLERPRPQPPLLPFWPGPGYPSGHSLTALCLALTLAWWFRQGDRRESATARVVTAGLFLWPLLVGLSRIYLEAHWLTDVLGGYSIGLVHFAASVAIAGPILRRPVQAAALGDGSA